MTTSSRPCKAVRYDDRPNQLQCFGILDVTQLEGFTNHRKL